MKEAIKLQKNNCCRKIINISIFLKINNHYETCDFIVFI